jgi:hypothetical protein
MDHGYSVAGLRVTSDLRLPGLIAQFVAPSSADITIARDVLPPPVTPIDPLAEFVVEIPGVMRMAMRNGSSLAYDPLPGARPDDMALFLGGTGFGGLLHQRGRVVLHASAVLMGGKAVLFCGASGAGKSTLATALVDAGYGHIADDFCAIDFGADGTPMVAPDGRRHKLWQRAIDGLALPDRRGNAVQPGQDKYFVDPRETITTPIPIGAIYALGVADQIMVEQVRPLEMLHIMMANAYRPHLIALMKQHRLYLEVTGRLANRTAIRRLLRPLAFDRMPELIAAIKESVANPAPGLPQPQVTAA